MMRRVLIIFCLILFTFPLVAQVRTGNIYGKIVDEKGATLPGVTVTLTGSLTSPMNTITQIEGKFRFLSLSPAKDYVIKAELQGFKTRIEEGFVIAVGVNANITLVMEMGKLEEEVIVVAETPVVDRKKVAISQTVDRETLQSLPTARDPWVILQTAPSIQTDRENIGGSESGQQSGFVSHGAESTNNNSWTMDGAEVIGPSSTGSAIYYDFDSFEEVNVTVGGNDVTMQTGGVSVNIVTRRGGNKIALGGRFYMTDKTFQGDNLTESLQDEGVMGTNKVEYIRDYGFNLGLPIVKDKAWLWMAYGVQDIKSFIITGARDDTLMTNYTGKLNLQIVPQNRLEIFGTAAGKDKWGRGASYSFPKGWRQSNKYHLGFPMWKIQDEHMFGDNLLVNAMYSWLDSGFTLKPMGNEDLENVGMWNVANGQWDERPTTYENTNLKNEYKIVANYFNENLFGVPHDIKFGVTTTWRKSGGLSKRRAYYRTNYNTPTIDITGDGFPDILSDLVQVDTERYGLADEGTRAFAAYISDSVSVGNFNILFGVRYDRQTPRIQGYPVASSVVKDSPAWADNFSDITADAINAIMPPFQIEQIHPDYNWSVVSPRFAITWDVQGNNKTIAKLSYGQYGDFMAATGGTQYFRPLGIGGWMDFWWLDNNGNGVTDVTELYWNNSSTYAPCQVFDGAGNFIGNWADTKNIMWGSYDPSNPTQTSKSNYTVDKSAGSSRMQETLLTLEREIIPDLGASVNFIYRLYDRMNWDLGYFPDSGRIENQSDYIQVGTVPNTIPGYDLGEAGGKPYYLLSEDFSATSFIYRTRRPDYNLKYYGFDFILNKRLSNNWMFNGSLTIQGQKANFGETGYLNPTNIWALNDRPYAAYIGGSSGKINQHVFSRWMVKLSALYQFPWDINVSVLVNAREGNMIEETLTITDYDAPNPTDRSVDVYLNKFGGLRLPSFWDVNLRLEKVLSVGDIGKIYLMADAFNLFNSAIVNRRFQKHLGTYFVHDGSFIADPTNYMANEVLNPRLIRFGLRFQF